MQKSPPFKPVQPDAYLAHPYERRGFITVPLDYAKPDGRQISILYRVLPPRDLGPEDTSKPYLFVINGGPGISARFYRAFDYPYEDIAQGVIAQDAPFDRFVYWPTTHRVVLMDQRGTDGASAPLDMDDPSVDAAEIGRLFSSDAIARDLQTLIETLQVEGQPFDIIAQSYGGFPGMQYLGLPDAPRPRGIIFSSSALPFEDAKAHTMARRREQLKLNLAFRDAFPDAPELILKLRDHVARMGLDPTFVDGLYWLLGKGDAGHWEPALYMRLKVLLAMDKAALEKESADGMMGPHLLNYILSSVNFTPGHTDRSLAAYGSQELPFEPWLLDEHEMLMKTGQDGSWREALIAEFDANPPPATPLPSLEAMREGVRQTQVLFTAAEDDAFVPASIYREAVKPFWVAGHSEIISLPGGHDAIFHREGHEAALAWLGRIG